MTRGTLHFTIGLPRGGKSTFCDIWVREAKRCIHEPHWSDPDSGPIVLENDLRSRVVISGDDFRLALHGHKYVPEAEGTELVSNPNTGEKAPVQSGSEAQATPSPAGRSRWRM